MRTKLGGQKRFSNSVPGCTRTLCGWTLACSRSTTCSFASSRRRLGTTDSTELCPKSSLKSKFISSFISSFFIGQTRPLFNYFRSFHKYSTNLTINYKSIDGVLGTWTRGSRMVDADESTELLRHPPFYLILPLIGSALIFRSYYLVIATIQWKFKLKQVIVVD